MLIGLCGPQFSGKGRVAKYLVDELGFTSVPNIASLGLDLEDKDERMEATSLPNTNLISQCWKQSVNIVITRCESNAKQIRLLLKRPYFLLVYVDSPLVQRYGVARQVIDKDITFSQFVQYEDGTRFNFRPYYKKLCKCDAKIKANGSSIPNGTSMFYDTEERKKIDKSFDITSDGESDSSDLQLRPQEDSFVSNRILESLASVKVENTYEDDEDFWEYIREIDFFNPEYTRPKWDSYFISLASLASQRTNCMKRRVGCVIVCESNRVVATGYNGTPARTKNCNEGGCPRCNGGQFSKGKGLDLCLCLHAEENAIIEAGRERCTNSTLYTTLFPCVLCARKIVQAGIKRVVYQDDYAIDNPSSMLLAEGGVIVTKKESSVSDLMSSFCDL